MHPAIDGKALHRSLPGALFVHLRRRSAFPDFDNGIAVVWLTWSLPPHLPFPGFSRGLTSKLRHDHCRIPQQLTWILSPVTGLDFQPQTQTTAIPSHSSCPQSTVIPRQKQGTIRSPALLSAKRGNIRRRCFPSCKNHRSAGYSGS